MKQLLLGLMLLMTARDQITLPLLQKQSEETQNE